ncbi:hypothetical protein DFH09DRAFT_1181335, partial [Mycena vulgaris]
ATYTSPRTLFLSTLVAALPPGKGATGRFQFPLFLPTVRYMPHHHTAPVSSFFRVQARWILDPRIISATIHSCLGLPPPVVDLTSSSHIHPATYHLPLTRSFPLITPRSFLSFSPTDSLNP